jgi:hypothetical protein
MKPGDMKQANCEKHGDYTSSAFVTTSDTVWSGCPDCEEDRVREYEAREQKREEVDRQRKTHLACALLDRLARSGRRVRYATVSDMVREIRDTWRKGSEKREAQVVEELSTVDLLVVDEVGVQFGSESEKTQLTELFDLRYRQLKPTVVISNLNKPDLEQVLGERVLDRLRERGCVVVFDWASWRSRGWDQGVHEEVVGVENWKAP